MICYYIVWSETHLTHLSFALIAADSLQPLALLTKVSADRVQQIQTLDSVPVCAAHHMHERRTAASKKNTPHSP